jgi:hypothetical protein
LGYSSNLSDAEWTTIEPLLPQRNRLGRPPKTETRSIVNAMFYMVRTGRQWRQFGPGALQDLSGTMLEHCLAGFHCRQKCPHRSSPLSSA